MNPKQERAISNKKQATRRRAGKTAVDEGLDTVNDSADTDSLPYLSLAVDRLIHREDAAESDLASVDRNNAANDALDSESTASLPVLDAENDDDTASLAVLDSPDDDDTASLAALDSPDDDDTASLAVLDAADDVDTASLAVLDAADDVDTASIAATDSADGTASLAVPDSSDDDDTSSLEAMDEPNSDEPNSDEPNSDEPDPDEPNPDEPIHGAGPDVENDHSYDAANDAADDDFSTPAEAAEDLNDNGLWTRIKRYIGF